MITLRTAKPSEATTLSELALRSKAHWGYSDEFMAACKNELVITPEECASGLLVVAEQDHTLAGFYLLAGKPPAGALDDLFVDPALISKGVGGKLFQAAAEHARELGYASLDIHSDPHAEAFYLHMGAKKIGERPSRSIPGRSLPLLRIEL
jgi:GNAT superfamily N-acetyltransferase